MSLTLIRDLRRCLKSNFAWDLSGCKGQDECRSADIGERSFKARRRPLSLSLFLCYVLPSAIYCFFSLGMSLIQTINGSNGPSRSLGFYMREGSFMVRPCDMSRTNCDSSLSFRSKVGRKWAKFLFCGKFLFRQVGIFLSVDYELHYRKDSACNENAFTESQLNCRFTNGN